MDVLAAVVAFVGVFAVSLVWDRVAKGRLDVWTAMPILFGFLGVVSLVLMLWLDPRPPAAGHAFDAVAAVALGLVAGAILFGGTHVFVSIAGRWDRFARHTRAAYRRAETVSKPMAILLAVGVVALGEELYWRGLLLGSFVHFDSMIGSSAVAVWFVSAMANTRSRSLPIIAAAVVGGALWTGLAWWTGGILASIASHMLWTGLMLGFPPDPSRAEVV